MSEWWTDPAQCIPLEQRAPLMDIVRAQARGGRVLCSELDADGEYRCGEWYPASGVAPMILTGDAVRWSPDGNRLEVVEVAGAPEWCVFVHRAEVAA